MTSVGVSDRCGDQLLQIYVVLRCKLNRHVIAADFLEVSRSERSHAALPTKHVVHAASPELIVTQLVLPGE